MEAASGSAAQPSSSAQSGSAQSGSAQSGSAQSGTILVAAAVVQRGERTLITQRPPGTHLEGRWEFPGGKVEAAEDPRETVVRECREECGIEVKVLDILDVSFHRYPEKSVLLLFYRCELKAGEVDHRGIQDHAWVKPEELRGYPFPPADEGVLQKLGAGPAPIA